ncbi:MAG: hypothetical protein J0L92_18730 [Deltaproteobacteria bacterium]|nr:hypothetical protein [Deltaproteobacteria bacterium]
MTTRVSHPLCCARCEEPLEAARVDLATGQATCATCKRVFTVSATSVIVGARASLPETIERIATLDAFGSHLVNAWSHRPPKRLAVLFAVVGSLPAFLFLAPLFAMSRAAPREELALLVCLLGSFGGMAAVVWFGALQTFCTRTTLRVGDGEISAHTTTRPAILSIPRSAPIVVPRSLVVGVDTSRVSSGWRARALTKDGRAVVLLGGLREDEARFLVAEIARALSAAEGVARIVVA